MAFVELNKLSIGQIGDNSRVEIASNYIDILDTNNTKLFNRISKR